MAIHIDIGDPKYRNAAAEILRRHNDGAAEANITSAVRDFLILTGLARSEEMVEENPPSDASRRAVDLTALDTFIEFKRRIGTASGGAPNPQYVEQLDDYLAQSEKQGRVRMGVLTDGKRWLLRWPGAGEIQLTRPYAFTLEEPDQWIALYEWLRDSALVSLEGESPDREGIEGHFGPDSPSYQRDIAALKTLYQENAEQETIRIKRRLWYDLLRTALGEIAYTTEGMSAEAQVRLAKVGVGPEEMDDLFVRHTYLSAVIGMVVQASFGIDIRRLAESDPADLLQGRELHRATGLQGVLESDFFAWPNEVGGEPLLQTLARRVARFDWAEAPPDTAATLYESVIPPDERRQLGEYYTPAWLARAMIRELVDDPLNQRVLDPACGSGTFVAEAVSHFIAAANAANWNPGEVLNRLREAVTGIDVHPVAVHLARAAWTLAARPAINAASAAGFDASLSIPVYLGDALQLRFRTGDMFAEHNITVQVEDEENTELVFPVSLVERAETFDALMGDVSASIERGDDPFLALDDNKINDPTERQVISHAIAAMQRLHDRGRNHIWAYYARNMVRPVVLSRSKVDVVIGNPPWINYNQTADILRDELQNLSRNAYGIWAGGRYATHQDVAGLFFARSADLYLKDGGVIGFVLPHSALQAGQYSKWRSGQWRARKSGPSVSVDFTFKPAWDLEQLKPNSFFPIPASVAFARKLSQDVLSKPLAGAVERWRGRAGADDVRRELASITDTGAAGESPYGGYSRQGAIIVPRCLFFAKETENTAIVQAAPTVTVNPRRGSLDKAPWRDLDLTAITSQTVEKTHLFDVYLGETVAPYVTLEPLKALLPLKQGDDAIPTDANGTGGIRLGGLERRMRERWQTVSRLWENNKAPANRLNLLSQLDYMGKLSSQLKWQQDAGDRLVRVVQTEAGQPTAGLLQTDEALVDSTLYWITCKNIDEANYLLAIVNSEILYESVQSLMPKGQFGARHLHKHLWKLPIPEFDPKQKLHTAIAKAGATAAAVAGEKLASLREQRGDELTVTIVRRELRTWLRTSDFVRAYPVSGEWLALLIRRMDAVASVYRLATTMSPGVDGLRSHVEFHRRGRFDATITLHDGRSFGMVRQSLALRRRSLYDRLRAIAEYDYTRRPDTILVLTPSVWEQRLTTRFCMELNLEGSYVGEESRDVLERRDSHVWQKTSGLFSGSYYNLGFVSSQGGPAGALHTESPERKRASIPHPERMVRAAATFGISPSEKRTLDLVTDYPMIPREHLARWLGVSAGRVSQMMQSLVNTWGLVERRGKREDVRYTLSAEGIRYVTHRDRAQLPTTRGIWSTALTTDKQSRGRYVGHRIDTWARQTKHADGITWFLSKLEADARADPDSELLWSVPTARSDRAYNWGQSAIAPDAVGKMTAQGLDVPFYLEYELRARHPEGVIARLSPYMSYYWSTEPGEDQPPFPTTLFVVDTEEVEDTYVRTAARMSRMSLPIFVSCIPVLSNTGVLGRSWRPLWEPESPRCAGWGLQVASTGGFSRFAGAANRPICPCFSYVTGRKTR